MEWFVQVCYSEMLPITTILTMINNAGVLVSHLSLPFSMLFMDSRGFSILLLTSVGNKPEGFV